MKRGLMIATLALCTLLSGSAWSYDTDLAAGYAELFAPVTGAGAGKALHLMSPEAFIAKLHAGTPFVTLDIRTAREFGVFAMNLPGNLVIAADQVFLPKNLQRLPVDLPIIVICQSGIRSVAIGTALRHIGFDNVFILKGGLKGLSAYLGPKEANKTP